MNKASIAKNAIYNAIKTITVIVFPLISFPYLSRTLHAENIGKINVACSIINYFILIGSLGINTYAIRECSKVKDDKKHLGKISSQLFSINICTMLFSYALLGILLVFAADIQKYAILICIFSLNILFSTLGADWLNTAMEDFKYISIRTAGFQLVSLIGLIAFVKEPDDYIKYVCISVLSTSGANIINILYRRRFCKVSFTKKMEIKKHLKPILLLFSLLLSQSILSNLDITMLGFLEGDVAAGYYSTAVKLYGMVERTISSTVFVLFPQFSYWFALKDYKQINSMLHSTLNFIVISSAPCALGLCLLAKEILVVVCGKEYASASVALSILSLAMFFNLLGAGFWGNTILLSSNREGQFTVACIASSLFNGIANYFLIPVFGMNGAAFTTLLSVLVIFVISAAKKDKNIYIGYSFKELFPVIIGCIIIGSICCICKVYISNYILRIIICILTSGISYLAILGISKNELFLLVISTIINKLHSVHKYKNRKGEFKP